MFDASRKHTDLVYARNAKAAAIASTFGYPTIYEMHQLPGGRVGPLWLRLILFGKGFVRLVAITEALRNAVLGRYPGWLKEKEIMVAPDAVDLERFNDLPSPSDARNKLGLPQMFTAGYSGSLYEGRGVELIMKLARMLPKVQFLVMGGDSRSVELRKKEAKTGEIDNIAFLGFISNTALPQYLAACEALLMPYQRHVAVSGGGDTSKIFSPLKLFEYMAVERLIISSDLPVLREILNERNSILCTPDDVGKWHNAILESVNKPELCFALAKQARRDVNNYTWGRRICRCLSIG
jgi:glycosyltransferase involved in cell wall biosynthesis